MVDRGDVMRADDRERTLGHRAGGMQRVVSDCCPVLYDLVWARVNIPYSPILYSNIN